MSQRDAFVGQSTRTISSQLVKKASSIGPVTPTGPTSTPSSLSTSLWTNHFPSYSGRDGVDFDANLQIDTIDYGTFAVSSSLSPSGEYYLQTMPFFFSSAESYEMPLHTDQPIKWIEEHGKFAESHSVVQGSP